MRRSDCSGDSALATLRTLVRPKPWKRDAEPLDLDKVLRRVAEGTAELIFIG